MKRLPDKPSELLRLALSDIEKAEEDPRYEIDMTHWHTPNGTCKVCAAGAVMAFSLETAIGCHETVPAEYDNETCNKLLAIDYLRKGWINCAFALMEIAPDRRFHRRVIFPYRINPEKFKEDVLHLAAELETHGY